MHNIAGAYALIGMGVLFSFLNWSTLVSSLLTNRFISPIPFAGSVPLGIGMLLLPETRLFAWLALVIDYGTLVLIIALPGLAYEFWSTSAANLLHCLSVIESGREFTIRLFRRDIAIISAKFTPAVPCNNDGACVQSFSYVGKWTVTETGFLIDSYGSGRRLHVTMQNNTYKTEEENHPQNNTHHYDCLNGLVFEKQNSA